MQKLSKLIGQCSSGHDVYVTHDLNDEIDGGNIGTGTIEPLPDERTTKPILIVCEACVKLINTRIQAQLP
jgi:hypothetical protein